MSESAGSDNVVDIEQVGELYRRHCVRVRRLVGLDVQAEDAVIEDACQVAWMRLVLHRRRVRRDAAMRWVVRVARHEAYRLARPQQREAPLCLAEPVEKAQAAPNLIEELVEHRVRLESIRALPDRQRRLVWLHGLGFSYEEMAGATGVSRRTVERQLSRARVALRRAESIA